MNERAAVVPVVRPTVGPKLALTIDVAAVVVFVAIGRRSHDEPGNAVVGAAKVAAPFLIALAIAWAVQWFARRVRDAEGLSFGTIVWLGTVVVGLALRRLVFDRGIATAFVIVTTVTLCLLLLGWRLLVPPLSRRRHDRLAEPTGGHRSDHGPTTSEPARK